MKRKMVSITVLFSALLVLVLTSCVETGTIDVLESPTMVNKSTEPVQDPTSTDVDLPEEPTPSPEFDKKELPTLTPIPTATSLPLELVDPLENKLVILAQRDLAERYGLDVEDIELVSLEAITWPDSSLGCPQPNMFYTQVLSPGYRIILKVSDKLYNYHTDMQAEIILCDNAKPNNFLETPSTRD